MPKLRNMREAHEGGETGEAGPGGGNAPLDEFVPCAASSAAGRSITIRDCEL